MARKYTARVRTQLRQAQRVERNNKLSAAEGLYREILQENPEVAEAWVGLGNVTKDSAEKKWPIASASKSIPITTLPDVHWAWNRSPQRQSRRQSRAG